MFIRVHEGLVVNSKHVESIEFYGETCLFFYNRPNQESGGHKPSKVIMTQDEFDKIAEHFQQIQE